MRVFELTEEEVIKEYGSLINLPVWGRMALGRQRRIHKMGNRFEFGEDSGHYTYPIEFDSREDMMEYLSTVDHSVRVFLSAMTVEFITVEGVVWALWDDGFMKQWGHYDKLFDPTIRGLFGLARSDERWREFYNYDVVHIVNW